MSVMMLTGVLAGCKKSETSSNGASGKLDPVELKVMLFGEKPQQMDEVLAEFEKRTKDTLNTKLNIQWNPLADHKEKLKLKIAAGEELDIVFDASFVNLQQNATDGVYAELGSYFNNDKYPGLKKTFSQDFIEANKTLGKNYIIPFTQFFGGMDGVYIRKDMREKYGLSEIKSISDLENFFKKVQENEKGIVPVAVRGARGLYNLFSDEQEVIKQQIDAGIMGVTSGVRWQVAVSKDGKKVLGVATPGDDASQWASFPDGFKTPTVYTKYTKSKEWSKYTEKDAISQKDEVGLFASGKAAAVLNDLSQFVTIESKLKGANKDATLEFFPYRTALREMKPGAIPTTYAAGNSVAIMASSKNVERSMKFFDWLFSSQENHDLFELGIEGKHWVADGKDKFKLPEGVNLASNYQFPGYELTWTPSMIRMKSDLNPEVIKYNQYLAKADTYYKSNLSGFSFDQANIKAEVAKIKPLNDNLEQLGNLGLIADPEAEYKKLVQQSGPLGLEKIREEVRIQVQKFLDSKAK